MVLFVPQFRHRQPLAMFFVVWRLPLISRDLTRELKLDTTYFNHHALVFFQGRIR